MPPLFLTHTQSLTPSSTLCGPLPESMTAEEVFSVISNQQLFPSHFERPFYSLGDTLHVRDPTVLSSALSIEPSMTQ